MGKIPQGILGSLSGKVGSIIGGSWKGIDYIRIKPASVANPRTEGQVNQRNKFTITLEYLQATKDFIKIGYKSFATKKTEFNAAMSYVLNNAVGGIAPNFTIDYSLALLSRGGLSGVLNGTTDLTNAGQVSFGWGDNSAEGNANATDKAMVLVYNPSKKESISILDGADRTVGSQVVTIPGTYAGDTVELFMAFVSADGTQVSNSVYLGSGTAA
ncbi:MULTISPECIES: DUF6266 family protein [Flavobacteriaceae]|uniref:Uncharacterized protein n=3 Tax=Flavobacteriaceae TaxID=49546 RepID=A0A4R8MH39_9FLAO|nr:MULTISPECIES: DUF6266 family protein [Flavobacteriaceae]MBL7558968.1 hypothetical protein [Olleya sediminilitoris]MWW26823.1 hypothetical protein [Algibacter lectus]REG84118.1 hypothetical protein C8N41_10719 [Winogradskyella sediminis]TDY65333.1 hypothetical protein DFQ06_0153 [Algibacter lectus]|tara:strand:- start:16537 stop:17178 length:642 start_codon:yes stop_codon:yes gene_type:complete